MAATVVDIWWRHCYCYCYCYCYCSELLSDFFTSIREEVYRFSDHLSVTSMQVQLERFCGGAAQSAKSKIRSRLCPNTNTWQHWPGDHLCLSPVYPQVFHLFITCLSTLFYNLFITCFVTCLLPVLSPVLSTSLSPVFHLFITCLITMFIHLCCRPLSWPEAPMVGGNTPHLWSVSSLEKQPGLRNGHFPEHFLSRGLLLLEGKCGWWGGKQNTRASGMRWQLHQRDDRQRVCRTLPQVLEWAPEIWIEKLQLGGGARGYHAVVSVSSEDLKCLPKEIVIHWLYRFMT